jgi:fatty acid desaturase
MPGGDAHRRRNYGLAGRTGDQVVASELLSGTWYRPAVSRDRLKQLMKRRNGPAIRDTIVWSALLIVFGTAGCLLWGNWACVPVFAVYGVLYGSASDSRWHECGHGTAFRSLWMNQAVYQIASFMIMREPTVWRWSHTRHHTDTIIVGRDPEIVAMRPPRLARILVNFLGIVDVPLALANMVLHASGRLTADEETFVPEMERHRVFRTSRYWLAIYLVVAAACVALRTLLPAMLIGLPRLYGAWLHLLFGLTQHAGLAEDVLDHRLNSRTVYMNPVFRFVYWNMNYHLEHHLFPMVPYHALPKLHEEIRGECPPPANGLLEAYREIVPTLWRQRRDPAHFARRVLPRGTAAPIAAAPTTD